MYPRFPHKRIIEFDKKFYVVKFVTEGQNEEEAGEGPGDKFDDDEQGDPNQESEDKR